MVVIHFISTSCQSYYITWHYDIDKIISPFRNNAVWPGHVRYTVLGPVETTQTWSQTSPVWSLGIFVDKEWKEGINKCVNTKCKSPRVVRLRAIQKENECTRNLPVINCDGKESINLVTIQSVNKSNLCNCLVNWQKQYFFQSWLSGLFVDRYFIKLSAGCVRKTIVKNDWILQAIRIVCHVRLNVFCRYLVI